MIDIEKTLLVLSVLVIRVQQAEKIFAVVGGILNDFTCSVPAALDKDVLCEDGANLMQR